MKRHYLCGLLGLLFFSQIMGSEKVKLDEGGTVVRREPEFDGQITITDKKTTGNCYQGVTCSGQKCELWPLSDGTLVRIEGSDYTVDPTMVNWGEFPNPALARPTSLSSSYDELDVPASANVPASNVSGASTTGRVSDLEPDNSIVRPRVVAMYYCSLTPNPKVNNGRQGLMFASTGEEHLLKSFTRDKSLRKDTQQQSCFWTWKKIAAAGVVTGGIVAGAAYYFYPRKATDKAASTK